MEFFSIHKVEPSYGVCRKVVQLEIIILSDLSCHRGTTFFHLWLLDSYRESYIIKVGVRLSRGIKGLMDVSTQYTLV